jgi:hypothetical protein
LKPALVLASLLALAVLPTAVVHAQCDLGEAVTTPITFVGADRVPVVTGTVNKQPFRFKLHSSDATTTLYRAPLEKMGLSIRSNTTNYVGVDVLSVITDKVTVGAVARSGEFIVLDKKTDLYDGQVGGTMLLRNDLELAFADGYMKQNNPHGCIRTFLATWDPKAIVVPITANPGRNDLRPWFWVSINGTPVHATIATEAPYTMIDAKTAARLGLKHGMPGAQDDGEVISWRERKQKVSKVPADVAIGDYQVKQATVRIFDMDLSGEMMVLGADFLRANRVLIAMSQRKLYITPVKEGMFAD